MSIRPGCHFTVDDLDYIGRGQEDRYDIYGTAEILNSYRDKISIGQSMEGISELGGLYRQLLQESDFFAAGRMLLKKLSPEEENEKFELNGLNLPDQLKGILLLLEDLEINASALRQVIKLSKDDKDTLNWITENWQTFLDCNVEDAMFQAECGLVEVEDGESPKIDYSFSPARDSYSVVEVFRKNIYKEASERRIQNLKHHLRSIQQCETITELEKEIERIREVYQEDKDIRALWSNGQKELDRRLYLESLHKRNLDMETIRRKLWFVFDRQQQEIVQKEKIRPLKRDWTKFYNPDTGCISEEGYYTEEEIKIELLKGKPDPRDVVVQKEITQVCLWDLEKSKDFCNLNQTAVQWKQVYSYLWEKMTNTLATMISRAKTPAEIAEVVSYLTRYRYKINAESIGKAILNKARKVKTTRGRILVGQMLACCQGQIKREIKEEVIKFVV